jgi:hypothetical protein
MSSRQRNEEKRLEREAQSIKDEEERIRLESRSLYEKIEDCNSIHDVKELLHFIVDELDECLASRGGFPRPGR